MKQINNLFRAESRKWWSTS